MHLRPKLILKFSAAMLLPLATLDAAVLVNLDATALPVGPLATWTNTGSVSGNFTSNGTATPNVALVTPGAGGGSAVNAVTLLNGTTFYRGPTAPTSISGAGQRTIEVWALNTDFLPEETMVAWARRGGGDGTNMSFGYGSHGTWGAMGHWGAPDMNWGTSVGAFQNTNGVISTTGAPAPNRWHHLVYTYNGTVASVYSDGVLMNSRTLALNTHSGFPFVLGGQNDGAGNPVAGTNSFIATNLSMARVRIHDTALSLAQIQAQYNTEAPTFGRPTIPEPPSVTSFTLSPSFFLPGQPVTLTWNVATTPARPLTAISIDNGAPAISGNTGSVQVFPTAQTTYTLTATNADGTATANVVSLARCQPLVARHRWSFNEAAGTGTNGLALADSVGGQNAFVRTNGSINATLTGTQVSLPGGASATSPYIDLPNGIVSTRSGDATWEGWMTLNGVQAWSRLFDFGVTTAGEFTAPGGAGNGDEYLLVSAMIGTNTAQNRFEWREGGISSTTDPGVTYAAGTQFHFAVVHDMDGSSSGTPQLRYYRNGVLTATLDHAKQLSTLRDVNNWLGRSNYTGDNNTQGSYNEFRVYDGAMTAEDVAASIAAGPDATLAPPLHIDLFAADTNIIAPGGTATLYYKSTSPGGSPVATISPTVGTLVNPLTGTITVSPAVTTTYTYTITEGSQTRTATQRIAVQYIPPDTPVADAQSVQVPFNTATPVTLTAMDPDNEPLTWSVVTPPANGVLSGTAPNLTYTPNTGYTGTDSFTFKVNDGALDSNVATVSLDVCPATAPTDIVFSDSSIKTDDTVGTMIARLSATDPGCPETHTFALVAGAGDTNNGDFTISGNQLISNRNFSADLGQTVSIRVRVTDVTGQSYEKVMTFTVGAPDLHVKINEIYYNSPNNKIGAEFIELHNPFATPVDLSNWRFTSGIEFTFPSGPQSIIPAGGYIVVSQNPAVAQALWGVTALGPWTGGLSSDGETIELRDSSNVRQDQVSYGINTPWPTTPNGQGPSLELVNTSLDNDLGGHWKAATTAPASTVFIPAATAGWRYRPGTSEASAPVNAWRATGFTEDATWRNGTAPIGLFKINSNTAVTTFAETGVTLGTQLTAANAGADMATYVASTVESATNFTVNYQSVFFRRTFNVTGTVPSALHLRVMHNDAAIVYINGVEVARFGFAPNAPADPPFDFQGTYERGNDPWSELVLTNAASYLVSGTNTLSIQGWAKSPRVRGGPNGQDDPALYNAFDFAIDAQLSTAGQFKATPGAQNSTFTANAGPAVRNVEHSPQQPDSGDPIVVTARISDRQGLGSVQLKYQIVAPGSFIPAEDPRTNTEILNNIVANPDYPRPANPAFENAANWVTVNMSDNGSVSGDVEGDGVFTAVIPPQGHRTLVRYRVFATDLSGNTNQYPAVDDASRNFAAFVYNGLPGYSNGSFAASPTELASLPVYHWIMRGTDFDKLMAYNAADQYANNNALNVLLARRYYNFQGALVYDGKVYDHVKIRLRGGNSRYNGTGKRHFRFKFPSGYAFEAKDNKGRRYPRDWEDMLFNKMFGNKGDNDWGLTYTAGEKLWGLQGVPMPYNHWVHFRVIRGANQSGDGTNGNDFFGLYQALELPDGKNFLDARNLPKGNFYKMSDFIQNGEMDERYQAAGAPDFAEDFDNIRYNIHPATPQADMEKFVNVPLWYKYNAVQEAIRHYDIFIEPTGRHRVKNLYWYFHPGALNPDGSRVNPLGQCWFMPYDWDASFGPNFNNGYDFVNNAIYNRNAFPDSPTWGTVQVRTPMQIMHRNAFREFRDLVFHRNEPGTRGPVDDILDDAAATIGGFWEADAARWPGTTAGSVSWRSMPSKVDDMKAFCFTGWSTIGGEPIVGPGGRAAYLDSISDALDAGQLGATPTLTYTGATGYPLDGLAFSASAFSDPQDGSNFAAIQWRVGEIAAPTATTDRIYEAVAVWDSGEVVGPGTTVAVPGTALREGRIYRARVRYKDSTGRFTHWSAPVEFTAGAPAYDAVLTENLYISEVMYKPLPPTPAQAAAPTFWVENDFEYIELTNRSSALTLDLTNVRFTKGIDYDFAPGTSLLPGETKVIVRKLAPFQARYPSVPAGAIIGAWDVIGTNGEGDSLSNGGEELKLSYGAGNAIHAFTYDDLAPWPTEADNGGVSMVYFGPNAITGQPDPQAAGGNWKASCITGGSPGTEEHYSFARWMAANGLNDPSGDDNNDGWDNLAVWAFARDIGGANPAGGIVTDGADRFLQLTYSRRHGAQGVTYHHELSTDLSGWSSANVVTQTAIANGDGTETVTIRCSLPVDAEPTGTRWFIRARAALP